MLINWPYPGYENISSVEIPDSNLVGVYAPRTIEDPNDLLTLKKGFANPIGSEPLYKLIRARDKVLLLVDDATRGTPVHKILPFVMEELQMGGVSPGQIEVLTAQGTHREMTDQEIKNKIGKYYGKLAVHQHNWLDASQLHDFAKTSDGTRVTANRLLTQCTFILGIGSIVPHRIKGFSGGAKIAFPGVAGREIQERNQWEAAISSSEKIMGFAENPMRRRIEEAAKMVNLRFIVNVVVDSSKNIAGCFVGDVVQAHRAGCELSRQLNHVKLGERADIVLIDSYPADRDFWQSAKAVYSGTMAVRNGGTLIVISPNPEGVADNHPELLEKGYRSYQTIVQMVEHGQFRDLIAASVLAHVAQVVDKTDCVLVSPGISKEETKRLGFRYAATSYTALEMALEKQGKDAKIAVLRHGGHILPVI